MPLARPSGNSARSPAAGSGPASPSAWSASTSTSSKRYKCPDCRQHFTSLAKLLKHDRTAHTGVADYECRICDQEITDIKSHMKVGSLYYRNDLKASKVTPFVLVSDPRLTEGVRVRPVSHALPPQELPGPAPVSTHGGAAVPVPALRPRLHCPPPAERAPEEGSPRRGGRRTGGDDGEAAAG